MTSNIVSLDAEQFLDKILFQQKKMKNRSIWKDIYTKMRGKNSEKLDMLCFWVSEKWLLLGIIENTSESCKKIKK